MCFKLEYKENNFLYLGHRLVIDPLALSNVRGHYKSQDAELRQRPGSGLSADGSLKREGEFGAAKPNSVLWFKTALTEGVDHH